MYSIVMGFPEMQDFWSTLCSKVKSGSATKDEVKLHKKMGKALFHLQQNPRHPGLETHARLLRNGQNRSGLQTSALP